MLAFPAPRALYSHEVIKLDRKVQVSLSMEELWVLPAGSVEDPKWLLLGSGSDCRIRILFRIQQDFLNTYIASSKVKLRLLVVLKIKKIIADPGLSRSGWEVIYKDPGLGLFLLLSRDPDPGRDRKKSASGMSFPAYFSESLETVFRIKNTSILWCGSGIFLTLDPEWKNWKHRLISRAFLPYPTMYIPYPRLLTLG